MHILYVGGLWRGSTTLHRVRAFQQLDGLRLTTLDTNDRWGPATLIDRIAHKLHRPIDWHDVNQRLLATASSVRPDVVFVDNVKVIRVLTVQRLRALNISTVFYTPDNIIAYHNGSRQLEDSWTEWSVVFTTKDFNVQDFIARGVKRIHLIGNSYDAELHRPMEPDEVGPDFERFDVAFVGVAETQRRVALNRLASVGLRIVIYGDAKQWGPVHPNVVLRPTVWDLDYSRAMHTAKVSLCFLRKMNGDNVTTRSVEIPAMGRPMIAERTAQHDALFENGREYLGFSSDEEMKDAVAALLADDNRRRELGSAGRERCIASRYSTVHRAKEMTEVMEEERRCG